MVNVRFVWRIVVLILAIAMVSTASCGRGRGSNQASTSNLPSTQNSSQNSTEVAPSFQPFPAVPVGDYPTSAVRRISANEFSVQGKDFVADFGPNNRVSGDSYVIVANKTTNPTSFAQYSVPKLTGPRPVKIQIGLQRAKYAPTDMIDESLCAWIGLANYTKYCWEWFGPYTEAQKVDLTLNSEKKRDRYVDKKGSLHFVVVTSTKFSEKTAVAITTSTTTVDNDYLPNNPHYTPIKEIYVGSTKSTSLDRQTSNQGTLDPSQYITLTWDNIPSFGPEDDQNTAFMYQVFRKGPNDLTPVIIGALDYPSNVYVDPVDNNPKVNPPIPDPVPGARYLYYLRAINPSNGYTPLSMPESGIPTLFPPTNVTSYKELYDADNPKLKWDPVLGALKYEIYASYTAIIDTSALLSTVETSEYIDNDIEAFKYRYYIILAVGLDSKSDQSAEVCSYKGLNPPTDLIATNYTSGFDNKIELTWKHPIEGNKPDGYEIYIDDPISENYLKLDTVEFTNKYDYKTVDDRFYWFKIKAIRHSTKSSEFGNAAQGSIDNNVSFWSMFGREPTHNNRAPFYGSSNNSLKWKYQAENGIQTTAAIDSDGSVYFCSYGKLVALNPDGTLKWDFQINGTTSPAIGIDGTIYVGNGDNLHAFYNDGSLKWRYDNSQNGYSSLSAAPVICADGSIIAISRDHIKLYSINLSGIKNWESSSLGSINSAPAVSAEGTIYAGSSDSKLYAINPNGSLKWAFTTGGKISSSPAIGSDGRIFIGCYDGKLYAISQDGLKIWDFATGAQIADSSPAIASDGTVYIGSDDNKLYAIDKDGKEKWCFVTGAWAGWNSPTVGADGTIYFASEDKNVYAINPDGSEKWSFLTDAEYFIRSSPSIGRDGTIYVGSLNKYLYAIGPGDGKNGLNPPDNVAASDGTDANKIVVSWNAPSSGPVPDGYYIYHALNSNGVWQYIGMTTTTSFADTYAESGKTYYYKVQSYKYASGYNDSDYSAIDSGSRK